MANIFESTLDNKSFETLQHIKKNFEDKLEKEKRNDYERIIEHHKKTHIFDTYEHALDWLVEHPDSRINWHCKTLSWLPEKNVYESFEQEYDISGVVPYDITRYYSREQLLDRINKHIQTILSLYGGNYEKDFLDENGKLDYVEII